MTVPQRSGWGPIVTAFSIWFAHFMVCWAAVEIWPHRWPANAVAWAATVVALAALGLHLRRVTASPDSGDVQQWNHRFALGAIALATAAVLFSALPSIVLRP